MAESLTLNNGATLATSGNNQSSAGDIAIRANEIVSLANQSSIAVTGSNGGSLTVDANSLEIKLQEATCWLELT